MLRPRWNKVIRDVWTYKVRTFTVVLTIALSVAGVGMIGQSLELENRGMADSLQSSRPADMIVTSIRFDESDLHAIRNVPGVADAEAADLVRMRIQKVQAGQEAPNEEIWKQLELFASLNLSDRRMDRVFADHGAWPPRQDQLLLERLASRYFQIDIGDTAWLEMPDGQTRKLQVSGTVRNPGRESATLSGVGSGYVSMETLKSLGLPSSYNAMSIRVDGDHSTEELIDDVAARVREALRERDIQVQSTWIPEPGKHWASDIVTSIAAIMQTIGVLALLSSAFLVMNTMQAIMSAQLRQIGIMQVLGATPGMLTRMYLTQASVFGLLSLAVGIPLGLIGADAITSHSVLLLNFSVSGYSLSPAVTMLQIAVGLGLPLLAALRPVWQGTRLTPQEAMNALNQVTLTASPRINRWMERIQGLPRPMLYSFRNMSRHIGRLSLALAALTLGGAVVESVFSVHDSLLRTLNQGWDLRNANRVRPNGSESGQFTLAALPARTDFIRPTLIKGRWLTSGEENAIVIDSFLLRKEPDLEVGDNISLNIGGKQAIWRIVGIARKTVGEPVSYVNEDDLARALGEEKKSLLLHVVADRHDSKTVHDIEKHIKSDLKEAGFGISSTQSTNDLKDVQEARVAVVVVFLSVMAGLIAGVTGFGLMGTISLNVMERGREFGILRSIGAGSRSIAFIVMTESMFVSMIGWIFASLAAAPVSLWICDAVGKSLYQAPLDYAYSWQGGWFWLGASVVLSAMASVGPVIAACRLSVRDVLAYE